jgi:hypothetical protein
MRRRTVVGGVAAAATVAFVGIAATTGMVPGLARAGSAAASPEPSAASAQIRTADIVRRTMQTTEDLDGNLGYDGDVAVLAGPPGTLTWLPAEGAMIRRGGRLYELDGHRRPILFYGARPMWRTLEPGIANGYDILELEQNLMALGFAPHGMTIDRHWDAKTTLAVKRWQKVTGQDRDGIVERGDVIFLPGAIRIRQANAALGADVGPGMTVLNATNATKVVTVKLDASRRGLLEQGAAVKITLPDDSTVTGRVSSIGRVASVDQQNGDAATVPVTISLDNPAATPDLDQAPVKVHAVSESHADVLAVPVNALVALLEGGYAVEVIDVAGHRQYVAVTLGLFQDGKVEIAGGGLKAGDTVVVPS